MIFMSAARGVSDPRLAFQRSSPHNLVERKDNIAMPRLKIAFAASPVPIAQTAKRELSQVHGDVPQAQADVIVALGGDGFMLETMHATQGLDVPVYGMNRGTVGFLMNEFHAEDLAMRLEQAEEEVINPLAMTALTVDGAMHDALAINEVSLLREGPLVATPAGSTAYNYSAHGPILPIGADVLALTAMSAFRPRRWRGALLPKVAVVRFDVIDPQKRPVMAEADGSSVRDVVSVEIRSEPSVRHRILFDPGHGLEERLINEQFA
jgi:NAD+ kinase